MAGEAFLYLRERDPWGISRFVQAGVGTLNQWNTDALSIRRSAPFSFDLTTTGFWGVGVFGGTNSRRWTTWTPAAGRRS